LGWVEKGWSRDGGWIGRHGMGVGVPGASPLAFLVKSQANQSRFDVNRCGSRVKSGRMLALKTIAQSLWTRHLDIQWVRHALSYHIGQAMSYGEPQKH
jgi:hypothetical protein